jgi:hypothetical protein
MDLIAVEKRRILRFSLLFQLYNDFFTYGYEVSSKINYIVPDQCRIEVIAALYYILGRRWIFFNIERDGNVTAYITVQGIDEVEDFIVQSGQLIVSNFFGELLIPVIVPSNTDPPP